MKYILKAVGKKVLLVGFILLAFIVNVLAVILNKIHSVYRSISI